MSDFDEYLRQGEPERSAKVAAWRTAIGLQDVDGLKPSAYLVDTAKRHIEGDITIDQVKGLIDAYYKSKLGRSSAEEERTEEADKVSARITELLQEDTFSFAPAEYQRIHRKLFEGIFESAGKYRDYNISNRKMHIFAQSINPASPKGQIGTLNVTLEERAVLNCISQNNRIIQKEIALAIGKSERTVKRIMASLSEKGIIIRRNGKRNGYWEVMHG